VQQLLEGFACSAISWQLHKRVVLIRLDAPPLSVPVMGRGLSFLRHPFHWHEPRKSRYKLYTDSVSRLG
jgi:hypothetical protein